MQKNNILLLRFVSIGWDVEQFTRESGLFNAPCNLGLRSLIGLALEMWCEAT